jgi:hypothetical protein
MMEKEPVVTRHALIQARKRSITPDMVEATLKGGKQKRFGKNFIKYSMRYKKGNRCVRRGDYR